RHRRAAWRAPLRAGGIAAIVGPSWLSGRRFVAVRDRTRQHTAVRRPYRHAGSSIVRADVARRDRVALGRPEPAAANFVPAAVGRARHRPPGRGRTLRGGHASRPRGPADLPRALSTAE